MWVHWDKNTKRVIGLTEDEHNWTDGVVMELPENEEWFQVQGESVESFLSRCKAHGRGREHLDTIIMERDGSLVQVSDGEPPVRTLADKIRRLRRTNNRSLVEPVTLNELDEIDRIYNSGR